MKWYVFFLLAFLNFCSVLAQDFDAIHKTKLIKTERIFENDVPYKIETYQGGTIKTYMGDSIQSWIYHGEITKTIYSDSAVYEQIIETTDKKSSSSIKKLSYIHIIYEENGMIYYKPPEKHGEHSYQYFNHGNLIDEYMSFYNEGKLIGKQTQIRGGQLVFERNWSNGIPNGKEISSVKIHRGNEQGKYFLETQGEWLNGEKKGKWEEHQYLFSVHDYCTFNFSPAFSVELNKCILKFFDKEIQAIRQNDMKKDSGNASENNNQEYIEDNNSNVNETSSLIEIIETREYFPDGNVDEQVLLENVFSEVGEGEIAEYSNRIIEGSIMIRIVKDEEYYPKEILNNWNQREDYQGIIEEKLIYQSENKLSEDGFTKALKESKLIKIEIFVNGKLYYCEGDC